MKSPAFPQTVDSIDFNLLTRTATKDSFGQVSSRGARRRVSRKNLAILTLVYGIVLAFILYLLF
jgi:hypothetical protein